MKKIIIGIGLLSVAGMAYAVNSNIGQLASYGPSVLTAAQVLNSTPSYVGQQVTCTGCTQAMVGFPLLCAGTETANAFNAWVIEASSLTAITACK